MAGGRRVQRSVRVSVAAVLVVVAILGVGGAAVAPVLVWPAAVLAVVLGASSTRIMYAEVVQTRHDSARSRAEQARSFRAVMNCSHSEHLTYTALMARRIADRDRAIGELGGTVRVLQQRAHDAAEKLRREARRANQAQERLAAVLDEVLGTADPDADLDADAVARALAVRSLPPTTDDLLRWDAGASVTTTRRRRPVA